LLASVPFRRLLNFTFDGLHQARQSVERLRNFQYRLTKEAFPPGNSSELEEVAVKARKEFEAALEDNLNTAEALAAIFEMVRIGNTAMDQGKFCDGDRGAFLDTLARWDKIFAVLEDNDQAKLHQLGLIKGVEEAVAKETAGAGGEGGKALLEALSDEEIERRLKQREDARRRGDFKLADQIRNELQSAGVLVEDTKAGTRWKRI